MSHIQNPRESAAMRVPLTKAQRGRRQDKRQCKTPAVFPHTSNARNEYGFFFFF